MLKSQLPKWFTNTIKKVMEHNDYEENQMTVYECEQIGRWTPIDLICREYLNNGGGSAKGFLGLTRGECVKAYNYIRENKKFFIDEDWLSQNGYNNFGFTLWHNYNV